jgi:hypothetical protein
LPGTDTFNTCLWAETHGQFPLLGLVPSVLGIKMALAEDLTDSTRLAGWLLALGAKRLGGPRLFPPSDARTIEFDLNPTALSMAKSLQRKEKLIEAQIKHSHCIIKMRQSGISLARMIANSITAKGKNSGPIIFSNHIAGIALRKKFELGEPDWLTLAAYKELKELGDKRAQDYRMVFHLKEPDRLVQSIASYYLREAAEATLSPACVAYRAGIKTSQIVSQVHDWSQHSRWVLRMDVRSFIETVDQARLISVLNDLVAGWDERDREILISIVKGMFEFTRLSRMHGPGRGILPGSPLTPVLINLYLKALDEHIKKEQVSQFIRYGDDIISFHRTKKEASKVETASDLFVRDTLRQELKKEKDLGIFRCLDGFDFVGFRFNVAGIKMRDKTYQKIKAKIKKVTLKRPPNEKRWSVENKKPFMVHFVYAETGKLTQTLATKYGLINVITRINRRLGFETCCDPKEVTLPVKRSKVIPKVIYVGQRGWPNRFIHCLPSDDLKDQFQKLDAYIRYRCLRYANRQWDIDKSRYTTITSADLRRLGLRSFMDVWNRFAKKKAGISHGGTPSHPSSHMNI